MSYTRYDRERDKRQFIYMHMNKKFGILHVHGEIKYRDGDTCYVRYSWDNYGIPEYMYVHNTTIEDIRDKDKSKNSKLYVLARIGLLAGLLSLIPAVHEYMVTSNQDVFGTSLFLIIGSLIYIYFYKSKNMQDHSIYDEFVQVDAPLSKDKIKTCHNCGKKYVMTRNLKKCPWCNLELEEIYDESLNE